jgi:broad specificity phosphatase PhoE
MVNILFVSHATTIDNEAGLSSGFNDIELSDLGIEQAKKLGERHIDDNFEAIFCSDLQRSFITAEIAFGDKFPIIKDFRLRECDYGDLTQHSKEEVEKEKPLRINIPFPNGESYLQTTERIKSFLQDLMKDYDNKNVMIIGHRATQYGLEYWINDPSLENIVTAPWKWQPEWEYRLGKI